MKGIAARIRRDAEHLEKLSNHMEHPAAVVGMLAFYLKAP
jgi:hypothetical protein